MPLQIPSPYTERALFFSVEEGFNIPRPRLEPRVFQPELERAFAGTTPTSLIPLDTSDVLLTEPPATTPLMLARYARIRPGGTLGWVCGGSGEFYCVLQGAGRSRQGTDAITWSAGDVFCLPGGVPVCHDADEDSVLYTVSNEPELRFERAEPPRAGEAPLEAVHYPAAMIDSQLAMLEARTMGPDTPGRAVNLSSRRMARHRTALPSLTLTLNAIMPGERQRPHRHNAAALVLVLRAGACASTIDGRRLAWRDHAVVLTPPGDVHTHANDPTGDTALALIVQDGGLHYHCRTMGFGFA